MNINFIKKKLNHSITEKEIALLNYQVIQTSWTKKEENNLKNKEIQPSLQNKVNSLKDSKNKNIKKNVSKTTFITNFKNIGENKPIKIVENIKITNQILGSTKLLSFNSNNEISDFLNKSKKGKYNNFWFVQLKQFFLKMPEDNINSWFITKKDIYNSINITNITSLSLFNINVKIKKNIN